MSVEVDLLIDAIEKTAEAYERARLEPQEPFEHYAFTSREQHKRDRERYTETQGLTLDFQQIAEEDPESILLRDMRRRRVQEHLPHADPQLYMIRNRQDPWWRPAPEPPPIPPEQVVAAAEHIVVSFQSIMDDLAIKIQAIGNAIVMSISIPDLNDAYERMMVEIRNARLRLRYAKPARAYRKRYPVRRTT